MHICMHAYWYMHVGRTRGNLSGSTRSKGWNTTSRHPAHNSLPPTRITRTLPPGRGKSSVRTVRAGRAAQNEDASRGSCPAPACLSSSAAAAPSRASLHARTVVMWGSAASMRATALPMPLLAPVTTATRALPPAVAWPHASPRTISGKPRALLCRNHTKTPSTAAHGALPAPGA